MGNLPSGTVTFLFTDIEGSTLRWEADDEKMARSLAHHDQLLRAAQLMVAVAGREGELHEQAVRAIHDALGNERFNELVTAGAAMNYDEAVRYVTQELDRMLSA